MGQRESRTRRMLARKGCKWANEKAEPEGCWSVKGVNGPMRKQNQKDAGPQRV
ncbi:hypothetical protein BSG1_19230 [Bacillus sp. SG-1]|nr:hypothetical protein BSG1_19230 [Bacillus sp. SG-1]